MVQCNYWLLITITTLACCFIYHYMEFKLNQEPDVFLVPRSDHLNWSVKMFKKILKWHSAVHERHHWFVSNSFLKLHVMTHQQCWACWSANLAVASRTVMFVKWVVQCGRLIPQWSQDCLEACCVWSVSGHFNISPRPWLGPHVTPAITGGSPSSFFHPPCFCCSSSRCCCRLPLLLCLLNSGLLHSFSVTLFLHHILNILALNITAAENKVWHNILHKILFTMPSNITSLQLERRFKREPVTPPSPSWTFSTISLLTQCLLYHWSASKPSSCLCICV